MSLTKNKYVQLAAAVTVEEEMWRTHNHNHSEMKCKNLEQEIYT